MTIAGGVADAQNLVDIMRYNAANIYRLTNKEPIRINSAARLCSNVLLAILSIFCPDNRRRSRRLKKKDKSIILISLDR